jgi:hypothetical protein
LVWYFFSGFPGIFGAFWVFYSLRSGNFFLVLDSRQAAAFNFYDLLLPDGPIPAGLIMAFPASLASQR